MTKYVLHETDVAGMVRVSRSPVHHFPFPFVPFYQKNHLPQPRAAMVLPAWRITLEKFVVPHRAKYVVAAVVKISAPILAVPAQYWSRKCTATLQEKLHASSRVRFRKVWAYVLGQLEMLYWCSYRSSDAALSPLDCL